jgi:hypothetical protein
MNLAKTTSFLMPVEEVSREVSRRLRYVGVEFMGLNDAELKKLSLHFKAHVRNKIRDAGTATITEAISCNEKHRNFCSCNKKIITSDKSRENLFDSSFSDKYVLPLLACQRKSEKAIARHVGELVNKLQRAATYCALATFPSAKPLRALLDEVNVSCQEFDKLTISHDLKKRRTFEDRARGGRARQRVYRVLDRLAIRLLRALVPEGGWNNMTHAAEVVATRLGEFIVKFNLKATSQLDARIRKVITLIREVPRARDAYERHRALQRTHRRNVR